MPLVFTPVGTQPEQEERTPGRGTGLVFTPLEATAEPAEALAEGRVAPAAPPVSRSSFIDAAKRFALNLLAINPITGPAVAPYAIQERARREREGVMADYVAPPAPREVLPPGFPLKAPQPRPAGPPPVIEPLSPSAQPMGTSTVARELPDAIRRMFATALPGSVQAAAEIGTELGIPGLEGIARRSASAVRNTNREQRASEMRLGRPVESVTPDRVTQLLEALDDPRAQVSALGQAGSLAGPVLLSLVTRSTLPAMAAMGAQVGPAEYSRYREEGLSPFTSLAGAAGQVAAELGPERLSLGVMLKTPIGKLLRGNASEMAQAARYMGRVAGTELGTEELSTVLNKLVDRGLADPNATLESLVDEMKQTAKQMVYQGPAMAGIARTGRAAPAIARSIEERVAPQNAIARAFEEMIAQGPTRQPVTIDGESRRIFAEPGAPAVPPMPARSDAALPELSFVDRINALLGDTAQAPAEQPADLPELLPEFGGRASARGSFPPIDLALTDTPREGYIPPELRDQPPVPPLQQPGVRAIVEGMKGEMGAEERGGRVIIDETTRGSVPGSGDVLGRTVHVGHPWWFSRPDQSLSAGAARAAIDKALAGQRIGEREQRFVDYVTEQAATLDRELTASGLEHGDASHALRVQQAAMIDEARVERLALQFENDDLAFMRGIQEILDESSAEARGRGEAAQRGGESSSGLVFTSAEDSAASDAGPGASGRAADQGAADQSSEVGPYFSAAAGEPWQMTRDEYVASVKGRRVQKTGFSNRLGTLHTAHRQAVESAMQLGRPVPPRVVAEYPALVNTYRSYREERQPDRRPKPGEGADGSVLRAGDQRDPRRADIRGTRALTVDEQRHVRQAIDTLGLPASLFDEVLIVAHGDDVSRHPAIYFPKQHVISIHENRAGSGAMDPGHKALADYLAHELTHAVDRQPPSTREEEHGTLHISAQLGSESSARLAINVDGGGDILAFGDLSQEIVQATRRSPELDRYFSYPLLNLSEGSLRPGPVQAELVAQVGSLYATRPELVQQYLPTWFGIMEAVYGSESANAAGEGEALTLDEARARLRQALQNEDPEQRDASGVERSDAYFAVRPAARPGAPRGPPGAGVGAGAQGNQQPGGGGPGQRTGGTPAGSPTNWGFDEPGLRDRLTRDWQDKNVDLKRVQEAIEQAAGVASLPEHVNARLADTAYAGRVKARITKFEKNAVEPLLTAIRESGLTVDQVGRYLWARHAPERNVQMAKVNALAAGTANNLSGLYDNPRAAAQAGAAGAANAADIISGFTPAQRQALTRIAQQVDTITAATRAILVSEDLEDQATINAWNAAYRHYVPLFRDTDEVSHTGQGFVIKGPESKRAMGSEKEAIAVVAAVLGQHESAIIRAEKAKVGRVLVKLAEQFPNPDFWRVDQPPTKRVINPTTGLVHTVIDPLYKQREDVYVVKERINGKVVERVLAFNPSSERAMAVSRAMRNLDVVQLSGLTQVIGRVTRVMANLATSWNPVFWSTNFIRDVQTAAINVQSTAINGRAPQVMANIPRAIAGILSAEFRNGTGRWARLYREFEDAGGKTGWMTLFDDLIERQQEIESLIRAGQRGGMNPLKWAEVTGDVIDKVNGAIENGTRLAAYAEARTAGLTPKSAAVLAKELTVNFNRKGNRSSATNAWYMFFNANIQGTARMITGLAQSRKAQAIVGTFVVFGAALELLNRMIGDRDRDEDGNNPYELIPEHIKQKNMVLMLPGQHRVTLPLPYGFNVFHNAGRVMMEALLTASSSELVDEAKKPLEMAWGFAQVLIDSFMPFGQSPTPGQLIAPSLLDPFVQHSENRTWYGAPMRPEPLPFGPAKPDYQLYFRSTSDTAKDLARWLSDITGGDEIKGGWIDVSPTTLTHIFSTITGGPGRFGLGLFDFSAHSVGRVTGEREPDEMPWKNVPFVGKFYGEVDDRDRAAKFYRLNKEATNTLKQFIAYQKAGESAKAAQVEADEPQLIAMGREIARRQFQQDMRAIRQEFRQVEQLPREERARARKQLANEEATIMARALRSYNDTAPARR